MSLRRALVECAVLSLQDSCVLYPCCKGCFSRIDIDSSETRLTCSKCGYSCARELLEYRYRLSVRVARGSCLFGVTIFGNCLNQFFGIHATGLQRFVADKSGYVDALSTSALLVEAVEECFIGKHFIFGIKITENDTEPWLGRPTGSNKMAQLIATQMILPEAADLRGCTVLSYFEEILHKTGEAKHCTTAKAKLQEEPYGQFYTIHKLVVSQMIHFGLLFVFLCLFQDHTVWTALSAPLRPGSSLWD
ncbi:hypothetical protein WMY93_013340 [Mugilogobius chulae]|uniref:Replication factor A C-terminal domain-containing protein n=1 Tax=Mugilogobius chulae TaxID=88201 RepID=A0AAW0P347_9GOBI